MQWTEEKLQELAGVNQLRKIPRYFAIKKLAESAFLVGEESGITRVGTWHDVPEYKDFKGSCSVCGGKPVKIRGRHPHDPEREVCPTCTREVLESIINSCKFREASKTSTSI